jgi:hypothetical protein
MNGKNSVLDYVHFARLRALKEVLDPSRIPGDSLLRQQELKRIERKRQHMLFYHRMFAAVGKLLAKRPVPSQRQPLGYLSGKARRLAARRLMSVGQPRQGLLQRLLRRLQSPEK